MIKQGTRKSLKKQGTVLLVNKAYPDWGYRGETPLLVGGDLLMLTGVRDSFHVEVINVATAEKMWMSRNWLVNHTSLAFDARVLETPQDA